MRVKSFAQMQWFWRAELITNRSRTESGQNRSFAPSNFARTERKRALAALRQPPRSPSAFNRLRAAQARASSAFFQFRTCFRTLASSADSRIRYEGEHRVLAATGGFQRMAEFAPAGLPRLRRRSEAAQSTSDLTLPSQWGHNGNLGEDQEQDTQPLRDAKQASSNPYHFDRDCIISKSDRPI